tara:strand:+ start:99 stop:680 length:582 start_codon:yes stop_codon:yes gene_type:complete
MDGIFTIVAAVISAVGTLGSVWLGKRIIDRKKRDAIVDETMQNANVYTALEFLMGEMEADRAYIMEFHNGEHYFSGRGQQKFSCTYEVVKEGISAEFQNSQNHRISNFHHYISELVNQQKFEYKDIEDVADGSFKTLLQRKGVVSIYNVPLKTLNGKVIGILGVDYVKSQKSFSEDIWQFMKRQARIVTGYLL